MYFTKIKFLADQKYKFEYHIEREDEGCDEYSIQSKDVPRKELMEAMDALAKHVIEMCELPPDYEKRIKVSGVSFSYAGEMEVMGAVISAQMSLTKSNQPLILNTPHKTKDFYSKTGGDESQLLSTDCIEALELLCGEAEKYVSGGREQGRLFAIDESIIAI